MRKIRVVIADDHPMLRSGLRLAISSQPDMEVVGEAVDGKEAIDVVVDSQPDVVVVDLTMPGLGGIEATEIITDSSPSTQVIALTMHEAAPFLRSFLAAGGSGYVLKKSAGTDLLNAIRSVHKGKRFLDPKLGQKLLEELMVEGRLQKPGNAELSQRELQVVRLLAQGHSNQQVGDLMGISVKTVESYRARIVKKLGLKTRPEIVRYAVEHRLLTENDFIPQG